MSCPDRSLGPQSYHICAALRTHGVIWVSCLDSKRREGGAVHGGDVSRGLRLKGLAAMAGGD